MLRTPCCQHTGEIAPRSQDCPGHAWENQERRCPAGQTRHIFVKCNVAKEE